ncbi:cilia- and flagella-associated protein 95-like [Branchiostoma lanceolatum]|uniref:cilia- and flagella-associated protein 95-like n=1 Tax=Branchiostoma lanceolatum TaxID=7740 RepID=UPI003454AF7F
METFDYGMLPDFVERKGSLYLRSDHMDYSPVTLNSNWHQAREAHPKDYDVVNKPPMKNKMHHSTYRRILDVTDGSFPLTSTQYQMGQVKLKKDFEEKVTSKPMGDLATINHLNLERDTGAPTTGFGAVLPRHHSDYGKRHLETTHRADYKAPYPYTPAPEQPPDFPDDSVAYKKCHSQFTDTADYRRSGINTWQDESGMYANSGVKHEIFKPTNTIPSRLT